MLSVDANGRTDIFRGINPSLCMAISKANRLFDRAGGMLARGEAQNGMNELVSGLRAMRDNSDPEIWEQFSGVHCLEHPIRGLIYQDPFTRHAFSKPRGCPGDAKLLDYIYGNIELPGETSPLGRQIYRYTSQAPVCRSVRERRDLAATMIDETADRNERAKILSIACGHLREGQLSRAVNDGRVGEFIALDSDPESLAVVKREQGAGKVIVVQGSLENSLAGNPAFGSCDLIYSLGIYDYLSQPAATRLTNLIFSLLKPGGRFLIANFAPNLIDIGYMETFMAWRLIFRHEAELENTASGIPTHRIASKKCFRDSHRNIVFLEIVKRG